jgi:hypothetical protein
MGKTRHCYHLVTVKSVAVCGFFWGRAGAAGRGWTAQQHDADAAPPHFPRPSLRAQSDALMSFAPARKSCGIVLDMFTECAINDS